MAAFLVCSLAIAQQQTTAVDFAPGTPGDYMNKKIHDLQLTGGERFEYSGLRWPVGPNGRTKVTWSFAADGTSMPGTTLTSTLFATLDSQFPSSATWQQKFEDHFARWGQLCGIDFERVDFDGSGADDGADGFQSGECNLRGDIRIFMRFDDGPGNALAFANYPGPGFGGDIVLDSSEDWLNTPWMNIPGMGFERTVAHEIGHAIGLDHVCPSIGANNRILMEPLAIPEWQIRGPWHDDVRGVQSVYGDALEPNDSFEDATPLTSPDGTAGTINYGEVQVSSEFNFGPGSFSSGSLSIDSPDDVDVFRISASVPARFQARVSAVGHAYYSAPQDSTNCANGLDNCCAALFPNEDSDNVVELLVEVFDPRGTLLQAVTMPLGWLVITNSFALEFADEDYFIRISPTGSSGATFSGTQQYDLRINTFGSFGCDDPTNGFSCDDGDDSNGIEICTPGGMCEYVLANDCNNNNLEDAWEISNGLVQDTNGDGIPDSCEPSCPTVVNSTGQPSDLVALSNETACNGFLGLTASSMPPSVPVMFIASMNEGFVPQAGGSQGNLCLGPLIGRFNGPGQIAMSNASGSRTFAVDLMAIPQGAGLVAVLPGDTWHFQAWHRDTVGGMQTSNFTPSVSLTFQ